MEGDIRARVESCIDEIRPKIQNDGGDIEIVEIDLVQGILRVRLMGLCSACKFSSITLRGGLERVLRQRVPEIQKVENVLYE
jgi:Fe-S cluster biogenesis protein NfuA